MAAAACIITLGAPANAQGETSQFLSLLNDYRVQQGLAPLQLDPELSAIAQEWAEYTASVGESRHPEDLTAGVDLPWLRLAENVASGPTPTAIWQGLIDSPGHHKNIVDDRYTHIGIGAAYSADGDLYISQRFMQIMPTPELEPAAPPAPPPTEPPPSEPLATFAPEPPAEVLGAVLARDVNLAVIPAITYGELAGGPAPVDDDGNVLAIVLVALAGAAALGGASVFHLRSRRT
jgi:hypothetical protein